MKLNSSDESDAEVGAPYKPEKIKDMSAWGNKKEEFYAKEERSDSDEAYEEEQEARRMVEEQMGEMATQDFLPDRDQIEDEDSSSDMENLYHTLKAKQ